MMSPVGREEGGGKFPDIRITDTLGRRPCPEINKRYLVLCRGSLSRAAPRCPHGGNFPSPLLLHFLDPRCFLVFRALLGSDGLPPRVISFAINIGPIFSYSLAVGPIRRPDQCQFSGGRRRRQGGDRKAA